MESTVDKDCSAYGGLFLTIISDLKGNLPVWEDFISKASKLHTSLKSTLLAIAVFLDAFQKVADLATGSCGATKEIGASLTRLCMRHKAIESKLKMFTGTILDNLVTPLQDCMEDWKKTAVQLDKDHAKDYKRAKQDIKKSSTDTVRLQKKVKKGKHDMQNRLDNALREVNEKYVQLEEQEKNAVRSALIEERGRFCHFVANLKPFVEEEMSLLTEVTHLQEIMDTLCLQADGPKLLPQSSEQVIIDLKGTETSSWKFQTPPSSPNSFVGRTSSMCSISSIASSNSGSVQSYNPYHTSIQQQNAQLLGSGVQLTSISSQDSGFTSQDTLFLGSTTPNSVNLQMQNTVSTSQDVDMPEVNSDPTTSSEIYSNTVSTTWTNHPNGLGLGKVESSRPHTISSAYEKCRHSRPALSSQLFEPPPQEILEESKSEQDAAVVKRARPQSTMVMYSRLSASINRMHPVLPPLGPKPKPKAVAPPKVPAIPAIDEPPLYANLAEISTHKQITDGDRFPTTTIPAIVNDSEPLIQKNWIELAAVIPEVEASTTTVDSSYGTDTQASHSSLHSSCSCGTMSSKSVISKDLLASGDCLDMGQSNQDIQEHEKYFTVPRDSSISDVFREAVFKRPASMAGIPMSGQAHNDARLRRRNTLSQPKPPPPVRRTPLIIQTSASVSQKYYTAPPSQLNAEQGDQHMQDHEKQNTTQQCQPSHQNGLSDTRNNQEHTYAELSEIQQSIISSNQQQSVHECHYGQDCHVEHPLDGANVMSATVAPQYMQPETAVVLDSDVKDGQNVEFCMINGQQMQLSQSQIEYNSSSYTNCPGYITNAIETNCSGEPDFPDLPPPPSEDELKEMEQVHSVPKQNVPPQTLAFNVMTLNSVHITRPLHM